jgi:hypothetical protein
MANPAYICDHFGNTNIASTTSISQEFLHNDYSATTIPQASITQLEIDLMLTRHEVANMLANSAEYDNASKTIQLLIY